MAEVDGRVLDIGVKVTHADRVLGAMPPVVRGAAMAETAGPAVRVDTSAVANTRPPPDQVAADAVDTVVNGAVLQATVGHVVGHAGVRQPAVEPPVHTGRPTLVANTPVVPVEMAVGRGRPPDLPAEVPVTAVGGTNIGVLY